LGSEELGARRTWTLRIPRTSHRACQAIGAGEPRSNDNPERTPERGAPLGLKWLAALAVIVALAILAIVVF